VVPEPDPSKSETSFEWSPSGEDQGVVAETGGLPVLRVRQWHAFPTLQHGFLGRPGGASAGPLSSLNLSAAVQDDTEALQANWAAVRGAMPGMKIVRMRQVHGDRIVPVRSAEQEIGDADAMMTDVAGLALTVLTADCVPFLMVNPPRRVVAAVHAGWRGTLAGIAEGAISAAERELGTGPDEWQVAMGPSIGGCCYEVDAEIGERLESRWGKMPDAWSRAGRKVQLDLRQANRAILAACGVQPHLIFAIGPCTACAKKDFFSHRASGGRAGRQLTYLGWRANGQEDRTQQAEDRG
jgi:YfiH family protein